MQVINGKKNGTHAAELLQLAAGPPEPALPRCCISGCKDPMSYAVADGPLCEKHGAIWQASPEKARARDMLGHRFTVAFEDFVRRFQAEAAATLAIDVGAFKDCSRYPMPLARRTCALHVDCDAADAYAKGLKTTAEHPPAVEVLRFDKPTGDGICRIHGMEKCDCPTEVRL